MNKKVSTLLTVALTLGGSLLSSSAFAEIIPFSEAENGKVYQLVSTHYYLDGWQDRGTNDLAVVYNEADKGFKLVNDFAKAEEFKLTKKQLPNGGYSYAFESVNGKFTVSTKVSTNKVSTSEYVASDVVPNTKSQVLTFTKGEAVYEVSDFINDNGIGILYLSQRGVNNEYCAQAFVLNTVEDQTGVTAGDLNKINRGSFSLNYQFDKDHKATENFFDKEIKAFNFENVLYFATKWPAELNNVDVIESRQLFNKCTFIVVNPNDDLNIENHTDFGASARFTEKKGSDLIAGTTAKATELINGKYAIENAQFAAARVAGTADEYKFSMAGKVYGLNDKKTEVKESASGINIALISDQEDRVVTTTFATEESSSLKFAATIVNNRTVTADEFLSTEKASVFNVKFVSKKIAKDATKSEYNKYLTIFGDETLAHGADFTNLNAPESQWIVTEANGNEFTFQNRENADVSLKVELISTDKENVYELRSANVLNNYAYVEGGKYIVKDNSRNYDNMLVELTPVTPVAEAGYVTTELDNAGLLRMVFNATSNSNVHVSDFYVTAKQENRLGQNEGVALSKEESDAAQFSVVKFDAASTATASSDTLYAYNNYVVWDAAKKAPKTIANGDKVAVVTYAFKQLRADGENYYLSENMQTVEHQDDLDLVPRFVVKSNKNGSYSLIAVNNGDEFREVVKSAAKTFDAGVNASATINNIANIYYDYAARKFDFNILKETPGTSYNHVPQHVTMEAVNGGYVAMNAENKDGIIAPVSTLKADYTKEDLTFWLDTTDSKAVTPSFMISKAGNYMYNATDSLETYNDGTASAERVEDFALNVNGENLPKVIFQSADLTKVEDIENYKFQIVQSPESEDEYIIKSLNGYTYVAAHNQQLYISGKADAALRLTVTRVEAPTSNEGVSASEVAVVAQNGSVVVKNAAGKNVVVSTILGQVVANEVLTSDNATINVPAGIVVVAVEGESFKVNVK